LAARHVAARLRQCTRARKGCLGNHAGGTSSVCRNDSSGLCGSMDRIFRVSNSRGGMMMRPVLLIAASVALLSACSEETPPMQYGANPDIPEPRRGLLPDMRIALPAEWGDELPTVPEGFTITPIATELMV